MPLRGRYCQDLGFQPCKRLSSAASDRFPFLSMSLLHGTVDEVRLAAASSHDLLKKFDGDGDGRLNFSELEAFVGHMQSL